MNNTNSFYNISLLCDFITFTIVSNFKIFEWWQLSSKTKYSYVQLSAAEDILYL